MPCCAVWRTCPAWCTCITGPSLCPLRTLSLMSRAMQKRFALVQAPQRIPLGGDSVLRWSGGAAETGPDKGVRVLQKHSKCLTETKSSLHRGTQLHQWDQWRQWSRFCWFDWVSAPPHGSSHAVPSAAPRRTPTHPTCSIGVLVLRIELQLIQTIRPAHTGLLGSPKTHFGVCSTWRNHLQKQRKKPSQMQRSCHTLASASGFWPALCHVRRNQRCRYSSRAGR